MSKLRSLSGKAWLVIIVAGSNPAATTDSNVRTNKHTGHKQVCKECKCVVKCKTTMQIDYMNAVLKFWKTKEECKLILQMQFLYFEIQNKNAKLLHQISINICWTKTTRMNLNINTWYYIWLIVNLVLIFFKTKQQGWI